LALVFWLLKNLNSLKESVSKVQQALIDQDYRMQGGWENNSEKIERLAALLTPSGSRLPAHRVELENIQKTLVARASDVDLLTLAREDNILISTGCYGEGTCGQCAFTVVSGAENLTAPTEQEKTSLNNLGLNDGRRLACQCKIKGDLTARLVNPVQGMSDFS
ncbi:MAG: (2Fe-2S)-binding protein, partial [Nitrospinae bacterium]|nr:(2Fe-2S)-binding protein [Nitrospinota bacterium]